MAGSISHFRKVTLNGLNTGQEGQRKQFRAPKTMWCPPKVIVNPKLTNT